MPTTYPNFLGDTLRDIYTDTDVDARGIFTTKETTVTTVRWYFTTNMHNDRYTVTKVTRKGKYTQEVTHATALEMSRAAGTLSLERWMSTSAFIPEQYGMEFPSDEAKKRNLPEWF